MITAAEAHKLTKENGSKNREKALQFIETKYLPLIEEKVNTACSKGKYSAVIDIRDIPTYIESGCFLQMICDYLIGLGYQARYHTLYPCDNEIAVFWEKAENEPV